MKRNIKDLINELLRDDPSLKGKEAELERILSKVAGMRPTAEPGPEFRERLKTELLRKFPAHDSRKKSLIFWLMQKRVRLLIGSGAVICLIAVTVITNPIAQMTMKNQPQQAAPAIQQIVTQTQANGNSQSPSAALPQKQEHVLQFPPADGTTIDIKEKGTVILDEITEEKNELKSEVTVSAEALKDTKLDDAGEKKGDSAFKGLAEADKEGAFLAAAEKKAKAVENAGIALEQTPLKPAPKMFTYSDVKDEIASGKLPQPSYYVKTDIMIDSFDYILPAGFDKTQPLYTEIAPCSWDNRYALLVMLLPGEIAKSCNYPPSVQTSAGQKVAAKWLKLTQTLSGSRPQAVFGLIPASVYGASKVSQPLEVKIRYFETFAGKTKIITQKLYYPAGVSATSSLFRFISAVSEWALLLNDPADVPDGSYADALSLAEKAQGAVPDAQWKEFIEVLKLTIKNQ
jgi:hypothetical protein